MKKIILFLLVIQGTYIYSQDLNFRGFKFGTDISKIIEKEGEPDEKYTDKEKNMLNGDSDIIYNNTSVAGYSAKMEIEFKENKLTGGAYILKLDQKVLMYEIYDPKNFVNAYNDLKEKLSKLYKTPKKANDVEKIEEGVSALLAKTIADSAPYSTLWEIDGGAIILVLNYQEKWSLSLLYISPETYKKLSAKQENTEGL